jgi:cyclophilin family peptidyl-prolyl cis-trans isomerase/HEAT repeat protein
MASLMPFLRSLRRIPLIALLPALACSQSPRASTPAAPPPAPETRASRSADLQDTQALLLLMADQKRFEEGVFVALLDGSRTVRRDLAGALGRIGDPRGRGILQGLLIDSEPEVRQAAAFGLGELGAAGSVPALMRAAVDDDHETGRLAVEALGKLAAPLADVRRTLGALVPEEAALRLAPFLFRFKEEAVVEVAVELAASPRPEVHAGAVYALTREARPSALPHLRTLLRDPDAQLRAWAARGLGEVGQLADLAGMEALLLEAGASPRIQALRAGARIVARSQAVPPLSWGLRLASLVDDPLPGVRATALEASAAWLGQPEVRRAVFDRLASGEPRERELALVAVAQAADGEAADWVGRAAAAPAKRLRAAAAEAAGILGLADLLETLAQDPEPVVRVAALSGQLAVLAAEVGAADGEADAALAALARRTLADADPAVRTTILDGLVESPALPVGELRGALAAAARDRIPDARVAGIRALAARAAKAPAERAAAVAALEELAGNEEFLARREAAAALEQLGLPRPEIGPAASGRTGPVYAQILAQTRAPRSVEVATTRGAFRMRLDCPQAPLTCLSFLQLAAQGYFDGLAFHRVVPDFVVQTGDPRGDGWGGPGFALRDEINRLRFVRGAVGMALSGPDTGGSQFFVTLSPQPHLDGGYTVFGQVVGDLAVLAEIRQGDEVLTVKEVVAGE